MAALAGLDSMARLHWWPYSSSHCRDGRMGRLSRGGIWSTVRQHVKPCSPFPGADSGAFVR